MSRIEQLAMVFESASREPTNIIDPPFGCVNLNLRPTTCAEIAQYLRERQALAEQGQSDAIPAKDMV